MCNVRMTAASQSIKTTMVTQWNVSKRILDVKSKLLDVLKKQNYDQAQKFR